MTLRVTDAGEILSMTDNNGLETPCLFEPSLQIALTIIAWLIGHIHPLYDITNPKYKLLRFLITKKLLAITNPKYKLLCFLTTKKHLAITNPKYKLLRFLTTKKLL